MLMLTLFVLKDISPLLNQISSKSNMISAAPDVNYMQKKIDVLH